MAAGGPASLSRFRGALVAGVLGDCIGGEFEGAEEVPMESVLQHLSGLEDETKGNGQFIHTGDVQELVPVSPQPQSCSAAAHRAVKTSNLTQTRHFSKRAAPFLRTKRRRIAFLT